MYRGACAAVARTGAAVITARQLLPPPSAEEYLVGRRRRRVEEEEREERSRRRDSVAILLDNDAVEPGTELRLRLRQFPAPRRELVQPLVSQEPDRGVAIWTGLGAREALRWKHDGSTYSPTALVKKIMMDAGVKRRAVPGPRYWELPNGKSLAELAIELEPAAIGAMPADATPPHPWGTPWTEARHDRGSQLSTQVIRGPDRGSTSTARMATKGSTRDVAPSSLCLPARCKHRGVARLQLVAGAIAADGRIAA